MIEESYVSFDTARMLKEARFDEWCCYGYNKDGNKTPISLRNSTIEEMFNSTGDECYVSAPTQALAARWLREEHHIFIMLNPTLDGWIFDLFNLKGHHYILCNQDANTDSYEQALEVGLQEAIKLIKK